MKLSRYWILALIVCLQLWNQSVSAKTAFSDMLLLPGDEPVRIKLPDASHVVEIFSLRAIPEGTEIAPDAPAPATLLCPNFTLIQVPPGQVCECPKAGEVEFRIAIGPPPPKIRDLPPIRGPEDIRALSSREIDELSQARRDIEALSLPEQDTQILLAEMFAAKQQYDKALAQLEELSTATTAPHISRLAGTYSLELADYRNAWKYFEMSLKAAQRRNDLEAQAVAHHYLAMILHLFDQPDEGIEHAKAAQALYRQLGQTAQVEAVQYLLEQMQ